MQTCGSTCPCGVSSYQGEIKGWGLRRVRDPGIGSHTGDVQRGALCRRVWFKEGHKSVNGDRRGGFGNRSNSHIDFYGVSKSDNKF